MSREINLSLLDKSIDDIEDLAGFEVPVNGSYSMKVWTELKLVNDKDCIETNFEVIECLEKQNDADPDTKPGTKFSMLTQIENDTALSRFKMDIGAPTAAHFGEGNLLKQVTEVLHKDQGIICTATVKRRADKEDKDKFYANVKNLQFA